MIAPAELWPLLKSIAFELRPFPMPSKADVADSARSLAKNATALATAVFSAAKFIAEALVNAYTAQRAIKLGGWLSCWALFAYFEFGAVFLIISGIGLMFANLGERQPEDTWSAYSVFNAGCRAILGSLDARQLERELMHQDVRGGNHSDDNSDNNSGDSGGEDNDDFVMVQAPRAGRRIKKGKKGRRELELRRQRRVEAEAAAANNATANAAAGIDAATAAAIAAAVAEDYSDDEE